MKIERKSPIEAQLEGDLGYISFLVGTLAVIGTMGTVAHVLGGSATPSLIGLDLVLLYGFYLAVRGWLREEHMASCAALLVAPALLVAAYIGKPT
ncbi:hypothetical protein [Streptomyces sp. VRA16 Mangrove soil]|uniref:hypothetical protein n=1 Tax=Streptomyces sp. VRA16 Mangrove soil TaxID=2817434 RepID=UPI001A9D865C|nr:hypothetical protein [Streptomyces sp. VRA16 Mangrove soil]MBO1336371.1 hypothetical protein [Streptomyces sp. VRA16 Mangrove soil]